VVPVVEQDKLHWTFFDLVNDKWVPFENSHDDVIVQYAGHGLPLTSKQVESLAKKFKSSKDE